MSGFCALVRQMPNYPQKDLLQAAGDQTWRGLSYFTSRSENGYR